MAVQLSLRSTAVGTEIFLYLLAFHYLYFASLVPIQPSCKVCEEILTVSRDRNPPDGYRLSVIQFKNGQPVEPSTSTTAAVNIMTNANNGACPNSCFRPAGLAWDSKNRLYMSSDSTGEIFIIGGTD